MDNSGILIINKAEGYSSHDCVNILRSRTGIKKIGHGGTLDPLATGVLPLFVGKGTKSIEFLDCDLKRYRATCKLGIKTTTDDILGDVIEECGKVDFEESRVDEVLQGFKGKNIQIAPKYSALKHQGKPLYKYAREGKETPEKRREIFIKNILLHSFKGGEIDFEVITSKGTYIRKLCNDIGEALGTCATMKSLVRLDSGRFNIEKSFDIEDIKEMSKEEILKNLLPVDFPLTHLCKVNLTESESDHFLHGRKFKVSEESIESIQCSIMLNREHIESMKRVHRVYLKGEFLGIGYIDDDQYLKVMKVF